MDITQKRFPGPTHAQGQPQSPASQRPALPPRAAHLGALARLPDALIEDHLVPAVMRVAGPELRAAACALENLARVSPTMAATVVGVAARAVGRQHLSMSDAVAAGQTQDPQGPNPQIFARLRAQNYEARVADLFLQKASSRHPLQIIRDIHLREQPLSLFLPALARLQRAPRFDTNALMQVQSFITGLEANKDEDAVEDPLYEAYYDIGPAASFAKVESVLTEGRQRRTALAWAVFSQDLLFPPRAQWPVNEDTYGEALELFHDKRRDVNVLLAAQYAAAAQNWHETADTAKAAVARWPESVEGHYLFGLAQVRSKQYASAEAALTQAISLEPDRLDAVALRAEAHFHLGHPQDAMRDARKVIAAPAHTLPNDSVLNAYLIVAVSHQGLGQLREAQDVLLRAYDLASPGPLMAVIAETLADVYLRTRRGDKLEALRHAAVLKNPNSGLLPLMLGMAFKQDGQKDEGIASLRLAHRSPNILRAELKALLAAG